MVLMDSQQVTIYQSDAKWMAYYSNIQNNSYKMTQ